MNSADMFLNSNKLVPIDKINGYYVRPGLYTMDGAMAIDDAINFTIHSWNATSCSVVLFGRYETEPFAVIPIPDSYRIGDTWSIMIFGLDIREFEYCYRMDGPYDKKRGLIFDKDRNILDPYAKAVTGQSTWGSKSTAGDGVYHGRVTVENFDWMAINSPRIPFSDLVIYELHVRGFTKDRSSGTEFPGTFKGLIEKIPYLKQLGVNTVELMPVFEFDEMEDPRVVDGETLINYWGYNTTAFFAPNTSYASTRENNHEGDELKTLIRELKKNGMQVFLDVVFNHTSEGDDRGPAFSFKGIDNSVFYLLTPDGKYQNFSGCGNTVNCNHPVVQRFLIDCLRHWVINYRVDGFRFDLASILGRDRDGSPLPNPPLLKHLVYDPILSNVTLIAEAWDAGGLYQVGSFPSYHRWAEWNGRYRDDLRCFLKGDCGMADKAIQRIIGSPDLYGYGAHANNSSVNFLTCHDGFTLYDLYSYNTKHNEKNGWNNTDGDNNNNSWNCGVEGDTDDPAINGLRIRLIKNAFSVLFCSRGALMFYQGDEFCNTQFGNNNPYCQDNITSWLDWSRLEKYSEVHDMVSALSRFRTQHPCVRKDGAVPEGYTSISVHNGTPYNSESNDDTHLIGVMYAGKTEDGKNDFVYIGINAYWEPLVTELPPLPHDMSWKVAFYTGVEFAEQDDERYSSLWCDWNKLRLCDRSVVILHSVYNK